MPVYFGPGAASIGLPLTTGVLVPPAGFKFLTETINGTVKYWTETVAGKTYYIVEAA